MNFAFAQSESYVTRSIIPNVTSPSATVQISLSIVNEQADYIYAIDEILPSGVGIVDAGTGNTQTSGHIKWAYSDLITPAPNTTLNYTVSAPSGAGTSVFNGTFLFPSNSDADGTSILGETILSVEAEPSDTPSPSSGSPVFSKGSPIFSKGGGSPIFSKGGSIGVTEEDKDDLSEFDTEIFQVYTSYSSVGTIDLTYHEADSETSPPGVVYKFFSLSSNLRAIRFGEIFFKVPTDWFNDNQIPLDSVVLYSNDENWKPLRTAHLPGEPAPTVKEQSKITGAFAFFENLFSGTSKSGTFVGSAFVPIIKNEEYQYYKAVTSDYGLFAISGTTEPLAEPVFVAVASETCDDGILNQNEVYPDCEGVCGGFWYAGICNVEPFDNQQEATLESPTTASEFRTFYIFIILGVVVLICGILLFFSRYDDKKRQTANESLQKYVRTCFDKGIHHTHIRQALIEKGWAKEIVENILHEHLSSKPVEKQTAAPSEPPSKLETDTELDQNKKI